MARSRIPSGRHGTPLLAVLGVVVAACVLTTDTVHAGVREVVKASGRVRYPSTGYAPLYPGTNDLQLMGPGVERATALSFPPGVASSVTILSREGGAQEGKLSVRVEIKPTVRGKMSARLTYPGEGTPPDVIKAHVYRRGEVQRISMVGQRALVEQPHRVRFIGTGFGVPDMRRAAGVYDAVHVEGDDTKADFDVTFHRCGTLWLDAAKLHDEQVPASEVREGLAAYRGSATQVIVVGPRPGEACPPNSGNDRTVKFCAPGQSWDPAHDRCARR